jgi:alkanesulfonate monooxygenase SsuD/methylene tetrahydromethanopterin reductase-like flavin-dependent oxidoreductase (luciferase family)
MRHGIEFAGAAETSDPRVLAELAHIAEESGWDGVFLEDYIVHQNGPSTPTCDPWVALAAMALSTDRIRLGTEVTPLPRRRPWKLARELATLDHLSNGRVVLGVGLGDVENDPGFSSVGEPLDARTRAELLDESLAVLDGLWQGDPFSFSGRHYSIREVTFLPTPVQRPRIPIWVGGGWPNPGLRRRAPRWDGICAYIDTGDFDVWEDQTPAYVAEITHLVKLERGTIEGFDIVTGGRSRGDDWGADRVVIDSLAEAGATWWIEYCEVGLDPFAVAGREPLGDR